jgi:TolB-like protein
MDVFVCLAEHPNELVTREHLLSIVWSGNAVSDEQLTRAIGELRRALDEDRGDPKYIETVPKRGYRLIGDVQLLEGTKREQDAVHPEPSTLLAKRKLYFAVIGVLAITVVYFFAESFFWADDLETEPQITASIAVLPFAPLSSGEDDGYFADGLTEEILSALAQLPELHVTARTSSFFFKGQNIPVPEIAARLNVAYIVEGSVRRDGERIRITVQLVRASDGFHLWSASYDRTLEDVFAVQEDIAENIAQALDVALDDNARRLMRNVGIRDVEVFIAYQKGLEAFATAHGNFISIAESLAIANAYFDRALKAAPGLTSARLLKTDLATHIILEIAAGYSEEKYPGEAQDALAALQQEYGLAWQLSAPGNQRDILDLERTLFSEDWSSLPDLIQKAMQPGGCPQINWTNDFVVPVGWAEQVAEKFREMLACDPMDIEPSYELPMSLIWAGEPEAALRAVEEAENKELSHRWLEDARYRALLAAGRVNDPMAMARAPGPERHNMRRQIEREALAGDPALARQMAREYWSRPDAYDGDSLALAAVVGDRGRANAIAARIDAFPGSAVVLSITVLACLCGAPFDLEATPNYKARIEEADFSWPPQKRIDYPTKTW